MTRSFDPPPHFFNPDDKRSYLLTVFLTTPLVTLAVPTKPGGFRLFDFPNQTRIYALYLTDTPLSQMIPPQRRGEDLADTDVAPVQFQLVYIGRLPEEDSLGAD